MLEFFNIFLSLFGDFISFLDSFIIFSNVSLLRFLIIIFIFSISFKFLLHNKRGD